MTTRENNLLLQFMEMVFPKDLLRYFELSDVKKITCFRLGEDFRG